MAALLIFLIFLVGAIPANALQCEEVDLDNSYAAADRVIIAEFQSSETLPVEKSMDRMSTHRLSFSVLDTLKGVPSKSVELLMGKDRYLNPNAYTVGETYLMFLNAGQTEMNVCEKIFLLDGSNRRWYESWLKTYSP